MEAWGLVAWVARVTKVSRLQVEVLLACGGDGDLYDRLGYSPYSLAIKSKCERTIALLSHLYDRSRFTICNFFPPSSILLSFFDVLDVFGGVLHCRLYFFSLQLRV
jgi:hypothetical protein